MFEPISFKTKRLIYAFEEKQISQVQTEVAQAKEKAKKTASESLSNELLRKKSIDEVLQTVTGKIDEITSPQIKKMEDWAKELRGGVSFLHSKSSEPERDKAFTDSEKQRIQLATQLDSMVTELKGFVEEQKTLYLKNKEHYLETQKNIRDVFGNHVQGLALLQEINLSLKPSFEDYLQKLKSGDSNPDVITQLDLTHDNIIDNFEEASAKLKTIQNSPAFSLYPQFKQLADELEAHINGTKLKKEEIFTKYIEVLAKAKEETIKDHQQTPFILKELKIISNESLQRKLDQGSKVDSAPDQLNNLSNEKVTLKVFDRNVEVFVPAEFAMDKKLLESIFQRLEKRSDLKPSIMPWTKFEVDDIGKIVFKITKGNQQIKYLATPDATLKITKDRDPAWRDKYNKLKLEKSKLPSEIEAAFKVNNSLKSDQKKIVNEYLEEHGDDYEQLLYFDDDNEDKKYNFKLKDALKTVFAKAEKIERDMLVLTRARELIDDDPNNPIEQKDQRVEDFVSPQSSAGNYILLYAKKGIERYYQNGQIASEREYDSKTGKLKKVTLYDREGEKIDDNEFDDKGELIKYSHYGETGKPILQHIRGTDGQFKPEMIDDQGIGFSTFDREKEKHPEAERDKYTENQYLDMLAKKLDTPEKWSVFFENFMQYTDDVGGEKWQTAGETAKRMEKGKMLGDCDDYATLAKEILIRQGKSALVLGIPQHAICVWVEKRPDGRYDAYSLCTFGFDKNGNRYGMKPDPEKEKGYVTVQEAINSLMVKYKEEGKGVSEGIMYQVTDHIEVDNIPAPGIRQSLVAPIEVLTDPALAGKFKKLQEAEAKKDYETAEKIYLEMKTQYPDRKFINVGLTRLYNLQIESILKSKGKGIYDVDKTMLKSDPKLLDLFKKQITTGEAALEKTSNVMEFYDLAQAYEAIGQKEKMKSTLEKGIEAHPTKSFLYPALMGYYAHESNAVKVNEIYTTMTTRCTDISTSTLNLVVIYFKLVGNTQKAAEIEKEVANKK